MIVGHLPDVASILILLDVNDGKQGVGNVLRLAICPGLGILICLHGISDEKKDCLPR